MVAPRTRWLAYPSGAEPLDHFTTQSEAESVASALALANRGTNYLIERAEIDDSATADTADTTTITSGIELAEGLLGAWYMEETGAADRVDQINSYDLTAENAPASGTGINNNGCVLVAASSQALTVATNDDLEFQNSTIGVDKMFCVWFKLTGLQTSVISTLTKDPAGASQHQLYCEAGGTVRAWVIDNTSGQSEAILTNVITDTPTDWHLAFYGYKASEKKTYLAVDDSNYATGDAIDNYPKIVISSYLMIGRRYSNSPLPLNATVDEVLLYDHILTDEERYLLWNDGTGKFHPTF